MGWNGLDGAIYNFLRRGAIDFVKFLGRTRTVGAETIKVLAYDSAGDILIATGITVPTDATDGYAKGCIFIDTNVGAGSVGVYLNDGTTTSSDFNVVGTIGALSVDTANIAALAVTNAKLYTTARGSIKVGGAGNVVSDLVAKSSGYILVGDGTDLKSVAVSGDVTLSTAGAVAIGAGKVTPQMRSVLTKVTENTDGSISVTAAQLVGGYMEKTNNSGGFNMTLDTAANIQSAFVATSGAYFEWTLYNHSGQTATLVAGAGVTIIGGTSIANGKTVSVRFINTGAGAIDAIVNIGA